MATAKLVVIFPRPQNENAFEQAYKDSRLPMIEAKLAGLNRFVASRIVSSPLGQTRTYRIEEAHFSDLKTLTACMDSEGCKQVLEHARSISTGGAPIVLVCDEESFLFW
ncbi:MAG: EthD family reductase [Acidobacteria bacterium]|nr:EthD family reductase [Acidobacteriota bacterium]